MILETLFADSLAGAIFNVLLERMTTRQFWNFFYENPELPKNLTVLIHTINAVLIDAEEKEINNPSVKWWLDELKDAVYEAEDVLDEIDTFMASSCESLSWLSAMAYKLKMKEKVEKIIKRLDFIAQKKDLIGLRGVLGSKTSSRLPMTSLIDEPVVFGRNEDQKDILEFLLPKKNHNTGTKRADMNASADPNGEVSNNPNGEVSNNASADPNGEVSNNAPADPNGGADSNGGETKTASVNQNNAQEDEKELARNYNEIPLIAIVGMPGVGKTTLAQHLFNNKEVMRCFGIRAWVHVSEQFNVLKVTKAMCESVNCYNRCAHLKDTITGQRDCNICSMDTLETLQVELEATVRRKNLLLVLDDVWTENFSLWKVLQKPLRTVAPGSRIIVTTRNKSVASTMRANQVHVLTCLSDDDCWSLFDKYAQCPEGHDGIRKRIVEKCKGLPLAATTLGAILYSKGEDEWAQILNSEIWDLPSDKSSIHPTLRLSYHYLPSHLKRCFAFCSIFPKGYEFEQRQLVLLWMAEGLLRQPRGKEQLVDVGNESFNELLSRSFFHPFNRNNKSCFKMHDLFNDLAQSVAGEFGFWSEDGISHEVPIPEKVRYFSFKAVEEVKLQMLDAFQGAHHLRTFLPMDFSSQKNVFGAPTLQELFLKCCCLRVLSLPPYNIDKLPDRVSNLKHLRYLNLSGSPFKKLPESIGSLHNLEVLLLQKCRKLTKLPTSMQNLTNLQHLDISNNQVLSEMPPNFGELKKLNVLTDFVVGERGSSIRELKNLSNLRGTLSIIKLQNCRRNDAVDAALKKKRNLRELVFQWTSGSSNVAQNETSVLQELQPPENLLQLTIQNFGGTELPNWLGDISFSKMVCLHLNDCGNCSSLPPLGQLCSLKDIHIAKMKNVTSVGFEFCCTASSSVEPFTSLETLRFDDMPLWSSFTVAVPFRRLQRLHLSKCPELTGNLPEHLPSLESLIISECSNLELEFLNNHKDRWYKGLKILDIGSGCYSLTSVSLGYFPNLEDLQIKKCNGLKRLEIPEQTLSFLRKLEIQHCPELEFSPGRRMDTPNLKDFTISACKTLKSMPEQIFNLTSLQTLQISQCPELASFPAGGLPVNLQLLSITECSQLTPQREWNLYAMTSLQHFDIKGGCNGMKHFPQENLLPASLKSLHISSLEQLKSLEQSALRHLTCLEKLAILECNEFNCIPGESLPHSLQCLDIIDCPLMIERCKEGGADWDKIRHIPKRCID